MLRRDIKVFDQQDVIYLQDVYDHIIRVTDAIDTYRDLLSSALDSYLSMQSNRLNQIVKALTIASIVLMSVTLVAGIYGMNFEFMPELGWRYGYLWALGLMAAIALGLIAFFRRIRWL
jgi:magnesium transporter